MSKDAETVLAPFSDLTLYAVLVAMGKAQKKTGKGRLDKYYKLAK